MSPIRINSLFILCVFVFTFTLATTSQGAGGKNLTPMQKGFESCLLQGGKTSIPSDNKGATCCFPNSTSCITCVGAYCSAGKEVSIVKGKHQSEAIGNTGTVAPQNKATMDVLKEKTQGQVSNSAPVKAAPSGQMEKEKMGGNALQLEEGRSSLSK